MYVQFLYTQMENRKYVVSVKFYKTEAFFLNLLFMLQSNLLTENIKIYCK